MLISLRKPSKRIIILLICAFVVIGGVVWRKSTRQKQIPSTPSKSVLNILSNFDNNYDLTDPLEDETPTDTDLQLSENTTISEAVSKNLFATTVYMSDNNNATSDNVSALVDNLVNGVQNSFIFKEYNKSSLPIIKTETQENLRFYASSFATLQMKLLTKISESQDAIDKDNKVLSDIYSKQASDIFALDTPKELADIQIRIINNFSKTAAAFLILSKQKEDPLKLPLAVRAYQEASSEQDSLFKQVGQFLNKNDIINSLDGNARKYWAYTIAQ